MQAAEHQNPVHDLRTLVEQMMNEPFCQKYGLEKQSLAKIKLFLEQREKSLERVAPEQASLKESFRQFKAIYGLFVMQLQQEAPLDARAFNNRTLESYLTDHSTGSYEEPNEATMIGSLPTMAAAEAADEGDEKTVAGVEIMAPRRGASAGVPDEASETLLTASEDASGTLASAVETAPDQSATGPTDPAAAEYYSIAQYFRSIRDSWTEGVLPVPHLIRLEAQHYCFALEVEFQACLANAIAAFWPGRKEAVSTLWDPNSEKGDFHPSLIAAWDQMAAAGTVWPNGERLPLLTFKNSFRYLASAPDSTTIKPSLLEAGLLIFAFGQDLDLGDGLTLNNALGLPGFTQETIADCFLRLSRVFRLKGHLLNPSGTFSDDERQEMSEHTEVLLAFTRAWGSSQ